VSTRCYLVATSPLEVLVMAAAWRAGSLPVAGPLVLVVGSDDGSAAARRTAEQLGFVERVVVLDELLGGDGRVEDSPVELVVGSGSLEAGRALARRLLEVSITLVAVDGDAYGPTPDLVRGRFARLVGRVLHLDLAPELAPMLLAERRVPATPVPLDDLHAVAATLPAPAAVVDPTTLVLGSSGRWHEALDAERQADLLVALVQRCAEAGHSRVVVLLDPGTRPRVRRQLEKAAAAVRADLTLVDDGTPTAQWLASGAVRFVVGSADPDLLVAQAAYGVRTAQLDTDVVLKRLAPFSDPRRTGATLVQALVPDLRSWTSAPEGEAPAAVDLPGMVSAVAYAMQPELLAGHRAAVIEHLTSVDDDVRRRFVRRRRLGELRLPGGKRKVRAKLG